MTTSAGDRLLEPEIWEAALRREVFAGLLAWSTAQPFRIKHVRRLTAGRSGSYVAIVRLNPDHGHLRQVVLKVLPPDIAEAETLGVQRAEQFTPREFWERHMVPTLRPSALPGTNWWVHTLQLANDGVAQLRPLADHVDEPRFAGLCGRIIDEIVAGWHQKNDPDPHEYTPRSFLDSFLEGRHRTGLTDLGLDLVDPASTLEIPGRAGALPNPLALPDVPVEVYLANGHGDLQLYNVLVTPEESPEEFRLIDYGRFDPETPVSRDPIKLLLSAAGTWLRPMRPGAALRSSLAELVVDPLGFPASSAVQGYRDVAVAIHQAAKGWATRRDSPEPWLRQHRLVLIGSALRMAADDGFDLADRWWFVEVAALAARSFDGEDHPTTPPSVDRGPALRPSPGRNVPEIEPTPAVRLSGAVKLKFVRRIAGDWKDLADLLDIPSHDQRQFAVSAAPARDLWEWLEVRERLGDLPAALVGVGRAELAEMLRRPTA